MMMTYLSDYNLSVTNLEFVHLFNGLFGMVLVLELNHAENENKKHYTRILLSSNSIICIHSAA